MKLYDIPGLNGKKSAIAGYGALLIGIGQILGLLGLLIAGSLDVTDFIAQIQAPLLPLLGGLGVIGIAHRVDKNAEKG